MSDERFVRLPDDAANAGKKIRNLALEVVQSDGTLSTVHMQVTSIVDRDGRAVDLGGENVQLILANILRELQAIRRIQSAATGQAWSALDTVPDVI